MEKGLKGFYCRVLKSATGMDVDFYDRETGEVSIGDKAKVGENSRYTGNVLMANGETYTIDDGTLTRIIKTKNVLEF